ncbi:WbqC family protein [Chryseobacterium sp.]|uniref:WbqC family protein n=1 Tax=Chryseobacterium sp. TaxID=1871047 RepID=UPI0012A7BE8A|nr:WbqC family protein [Chryseobacterium sp.]QFG53912.1 WbqC family protein [Chryseobacterium sp.]
MNVLLPLFYLPPISWYAEFLKPDRGITLEQFENFPKQTYRNRAIIYGANGKLALMIPVSHNGNRFYRETVISYAEDWQKIHWKSIKTAYQSSPYFEFYEDKLQTIYSEKKKYLFDFNLMVLDVIQSLLKTEVSFAMTQEFIKEPEHNNLRDHFSAKNAQPKGLPEYYQSFSAKHGFIEDLSVLDLLCNIGPESTTYLRNISTIQY